MFIAKSGTVEALSFEAQRRNQRMKKRVQKPRKKAGRRLRFSTRIDAIRAIGDK